ncbi:MarR family winged helix-turn-helix transcriptional regulator [Actinomadura terrae]|uniref:MarR family winged helix-turn-helix transcriptional regulator n=1 Tax=Actinomadura terrae TaxID=604353 RepID=UPI001FA7E3AE|nr:MarR family transcriptional regulator [Actinomadura terrae]
MSSGEGSVPEVSSTLGYLLKHAQHRMVELNTSALAPYGIDGRDLGILLALAGHEPGSQQQAAKRLGIDRTTMVAMLDALERKGIVARRPHAEDRRRNVVELTEAGRETLRLAVEASRAAERELLAPLTLQAADQLRDALRTVVLRPEDGSEVRES